MDDTLVIEETTKLHWFDHDEARHLVPNYMLEGLPDLGVGDRLAFGGYSYVISEVERYQEIPTEEVYLVIQKHVAGHVPYWTDINTKLLDGWWQEEQLEEASKRMEELQKDCHAKGGSTLFRLVRRNVAEMVIAGSLKR